jgi:SAM-dependent methyltransferase
MPIDPAATHCVFCQSAATRIVARDLYHPRVRSHGPVSIYVCDTCGSMGTWPVPSEQALAELYASFEEGIDPALRRLRGDAPPTAWYARAVNHAVRAAGLPQRADFIWIDVAAGAGEVGGILNSQFPKAKGVSVDWHARPAKLAADPRHDWIATDLNAPRFAAVIGATADLVIALSVWEHVRDPAQFVRDACALVKPGGTLYLACPDFGSLASRMLGRKWPFWIPGEHLHVPTRRGARICIARAMAESAIVASEFVRPVGVPYPLAYVAGYLGLGGFAKLLRGLPAMPLPVGALEAGFSSRAQ